MGGGRPAKKGKILPNFTMSPAKTGSEVGKYEHAVPWVVMFWCLAHWLERSLSDSHKNTYFATSIDEMFLLLYHIYENKMSELEDM